VSRRILLTGGRSMLGAAVALRLAGRGDEVTLLQRRPAGLGLPEVLADLGEAGQSETILRAHTGQDTVIHLAAKVGILGTWPEFHRTNVLGTGMVVQACRQRGVPHLVHISTPSVAHTGAALVGVTAGPAEPEHARGHYARSKALAEQIALAADGPDLKVLAIRPHIVWGPGDTQLVEKVIDRARRGTLPLLGSGAALVDSTYVDNAVDAIVAAVDRVNRVHGRALVVTNGEPRPVAELVAGIAAAGGAAPPRRRVPAELAYLAGAAAEGVWEMRRLLGRPAVTDPPMTRFLAEQLSTAHWFDQRETRALLDWRPQVDLDTGFARLAAAYADLGGRPDPR
jgi:nucleoside-diphosphate-sugar epimerase